MYKLKIIDTEFGVIKNVIRQADNAAIPFASDNSDFAQFKKDLADGAELQDADGNVIDGIAYLATLES
jgi:hypothetical protein